MANQPNAVVTLDLNLVLIPGSSKPSVANENVSCSTTIANYVADVTNFANAVYQNYLIPSGYATPVTTVVADPLRVVAVEGTAKASLTGINYVVKIQNVTSPTPPYTQTGLQGGFQPEKEDRWTGTVGPADFTGPVDLGAALVKEVAKAIAFTNYG